MGSFFLPVIRLFEKPLICSGFRAARDKGFAFPMYSPICSDEGIVPYISRMNREIAKAFSIRSSSIAAIPKE